jgi:hypothetical protein
VVMAEMNTERPARSGNEIVRHYGLVSDFNVADCGFSSLSAIPTASKTSSRQRFSVSVGDACSQLNPAQHVANEIYGNQSLYFISTK